MSSEKAIKRQDVLTATVQNQRGRLLSFIQKMTRNEAEAEDVMHRHHRHMGRHFWKNMPEEERNKLREKLRGKIHDPSGPEEK